MVSMFWLGVGSCVAGGVVCHIFVLQLRVPRAPWDRRLLGESVAFTTETPPSTHRGDAISVTGGCAVQNLYFQALKMPCSCDESVLCV